MFKVTDTFLQEITDFGLDGVGVTRINDIPVFVPYAVKGDLCKIKITEIKKNVAYARLVKVVRPSSVRIDPPCERYFDCGGCVLQHIDFQEENNIKRELLSRTLKKAGIDVEVNGTVSETPYEYRNKLQLPFAIIDGKVVLGFYKRGTHDVVPLKKCLLHGEWAEKMISIVTYWANEYNVDTYNEERKGGLLRHLVVRRVDNFYYITLVINGKKVPKVDVLYSLLSHEFECALYISVNTKHNNVIMGDSAEKVFGQDRYVDVDGVKIKLSPMSFLQVNDKIRARLYASVIQNIDGADIIFDVYSGVGILTAMLAKGNENAKVYGLEIVKEAVDNANQLMHDNNLDMRVTNIVGDASIELPKLAKSLFNNNKTNDKHCVCTVIDPPRKGCDERVLQAIIESDSDKVIYISCNPATLQRDLQILTKEYTIQSVTPYNMFPRTSELETLVVLCRR